MSPLRLTGSTSGFSQLDAPAIAGDQTFTLPSTGGPLDRLNRAGNVLQVVNATYSTEVISSSSTFADTGLSASITPSSASSKILITVNQAGCGKTNGNTLLSLRLLRGSTSLIDFERRAGNNDTTTYNFIGSCSCSYLDSPATTSIITYKTQFASHANISQVFVNSSAGGVASTSTITLMEIAA
jgi:hypothetical protein